MDASNKNYVLRVLQGPGKGQVHRLGNEQVTIGAGGGCDIREAGQYMSDVHAVLDRQPNGSWTITNRSPNGSFVNKARIDSKALNDEDYLQFGSEVLMQFVADVKPKKRGLFESKKKPAPEAEDTEKKPSIIKEKPGLVYGVGAYILGFIGFAVYLASADFNELPPGLDREEVNLALESTRSVLLAQEDLPSRYMINSRADDTALFYSIIAKGAVRGETSDRTAQVDSLVSEIERRFFVAWQHEKRNQLELAAAEYEAIIGMAPDIRVPTTALASKRLAFVRGEIVSG